MPALLSPVARALSIAALSVGLIAPAQAMLKVGDVAPDFSLDAAIGGEATHVKLSEQLKKGPVVVYFYPKAFTKGCTVEAHLFADATEEFHALGATVYGVSNDDLPTLKKFSVEACRAKFAVAADVGAKTIKAYDVGLLVKPDMADRVSYVIDTSGKIALAYSSLSPAGHVSQALEAVKKLKK